MITETRPLKTLTYEKPDWRSSRYTRDDAFNCHTGETVDVEGLYFDDDEKFRFVESCTATWHEKDGTKDGEYENRREVRCLEPAIYYVKVPHCASGGVYCNFHRPIIVGM